MRYDKASLKVICCIFAVGMIVMSWSTAHGGNDYPQYRLVIENPFSTPEYSRCELITKQQEDPIIIIAASGPGGSDPFSCRRWLLSEPMGKLGEYELTVGLQLDGRIVGEWIIEMAVRDYSDIQICYDEDYGFLICDQTEQSFDNELFNP